jgi:nucleoside-diphosphate-sugar epimerase
VSTLIFGCGFLGQRLGAALVQRGEIVFGTVRSERRAAEIAGLGIKPVVADVLQRESLRALPRTDRVFCCVGFDRSAGAPMRAVYVKGLHHILEKLASSVDRLVYASSTGVYGQTHAEWVDEDSPASPRHESGRICLEAESLAGDWAQSRTRTVVILRFAGLYGPGRLAHRVLLASGTPIPGDPERYLNLIHIDDAVRSAAAALDSTGPELVYLVADDRPVKRREYYSLAARILGLPEPRFSCVDLQGPQADRDATNKRIANHRMKRGLGVTLQYPDIASGLPAALSPSAPAH